MDIAGGDDRSLGGGSASTEEAAECVVLSVREASALGCLFSFSLLGNGGGGMLLVSMVWDTVDKLEAHGSRNVGGSGHLESSRTRFRLRDSMVMSVNVPMRWCCLQSS